MAYSPMYYEQPLVILSSSGSSLTLFGDLSVNSTTGASGLTNGSMVLAGGIAVAKGANFGGDVVIQSTTESTGITSGALVVRGGAGVTKNFSVGGTMTVSGDLVVGGTTTTVNSTTVNIEDNTLLLNAGPAGSKDAGIVIQRYQVDNNAGTGDVVNSSEPAAYTSTLQAGSSATQLVLDAGASAADNAYTGWWIKMTDGDAVSNARRITAYTGSSRTATLSTALAAAPTVGDAVSLYNKNYSMTYYNETNDEFVFGFTADVTDITASIVSAGYSNVRAQGLFATNSTVTNLKVTNLSAGSFTLDSGNFTNSVVTNSTITNLVNTYTSTGSIFVNTSLLANNATLGTIVNTSTASFLGQTTIANLFSTNSSIGLLNLGSATVGALEVSGGSKFTLGITTGTLFVSSGAFITSATVSNLVNTNGSFVNVTASNIVGTNATISGLWATDATASTLTANALTAGNLFVSGGAYLTGLTTPSLVSTDASLVNGSIGTLNATNVIGGLVTLGSVTVTGASTFSLGITSGTLFVSSGAFITSASIGTVLATTANLITANVTTANLLTATVTNGGFVNATVSNLRASDSILTNVATSTFTAGSIDVTGASLFELGITTGTLFVSSGAFATTLTAGQLFANTLSVSQGAVFTTGFTSASAALFSGAVNANSGLNVSSAALFVGGVTSNTLFTPDLTATNSTITSGVLGAATIGTLFVSGGSTFKNNVTITGGSLTVNNVDMSPNPSDIVKELMFTAGNNVSAAEDITGFLFGSSVRAFEALVSVTILTTDDLDNRYALYQLRGIHKLGVWTINTSYIGNATGVTFTITNAGQLQYVSTNVSGFVSDTVKVRAQTTSV